jgi:hypothetical protein
MSDYAIPLGRDDDSHGVIRTKDGAYVPPDPANRDWQEYCRWLDDGGEPDPEPPEREPATEGPSRKP